MSFNHFDEQGRAHMVDVSQKPLSERCARAEAVIRLTPDLLALVFSDEMSKGDVLGVARLAAIAAVKKTPDLIPLAHPLAIHHVTVDFHHNQKAGTITAVCEVRALERTGVEMEAMTGATVAALTVYDMCKGHDKGISLGPIRLLHKSGGKSGVYNREAGVE
jgi:cyclic pyranopterin monophosphate synthase